MSSVRTEVVVEAPAERAFRVFTEKMSTWWPASHHIGKADLKDIILDGRTGGRWAEIGVDGSECNWGKVLVWDPPKRLVLSWQLTSAWQYDESFITEVEIRFTPVSASRTRVALEHRDLEKFGMDEETVRNSVGSEGGWPGILKLFAAAAENVAAAV